MRKESTTEDRKTTPRLWRTLDELAQTPEFREQVEREFPSSAGEWDDAASRRTFLKVMGASIALAGVGGCVKPNTVKLVPYVRQPEDLVPGRALQFASTFTFRGYARGIVVESHEGRPTKIEGNPLHPASLGAADAITQAHVLNLYDPDRSPNVLHVGEVSSWNSFIKTMNAELAGRKTSGGKGIRILTGSVTSPTLAEQINAFLKAYPGAQWHQYEAISTDQQLAGLQQAFGKVVAPVYHFDRAKVIVSLDDNFLMDHPGSVRYAREFIDGRRVRPKLNRREMNRLYVAESTPTVTGAMADERVRVKPSGILSIARALAAGEASSDFLKNLLADLEANRGASLIVAGENQPAEVHALAAAINAKYGNTSKTVDYIEPVEANIAAGAKSLTDLVADLNDKTVDVLILIGTNPVFDAPSDLAFAEKLEAFSKTIGKISVHLSQRYDETSFLCQWHLPQAHELEAWGDARAYDGTASLIQPLIAPLYQGRSEVELFAILLGVSDRSGYELVRDYWQSVTPDDFETKWTNWLHDGVIAGSASPPLNVTLLSANATAQTTPPAAGGIELIFRPDPFIWDGRYANNGWLMEAPRPLTKLTWDNAAIMSAKTAEQFGAPEDFRARANGPVVSLTVNGKTVNAPIWILPGHPDECVTIHLGFGRARAGRIGGDVTASPEIKTGFNAYALRTSTNPWFVGGLEVKATGEQYMLACTQNHVMMDQHERNLIHVLPVAAKAHGEGAESAASGEGHRTVSLSMYPPRDYHDDVRQGNKWGMVIDQNACIGCTACVVACQAENNIAVVGKEQVSKGREMHWLRIDTYFAGENEHDVEGPFFQPLPCMHCENAPCEVVCPANATMHDAEGTNNMVYNRCIGTRYCSNNCPYKVRHFNFLHYTKDWVTSESQKMVNNPNVTVRSRGIMEKCSYCIQRINAKRIDSKREWVNKQRAEDAIYDGEVVTACQQSCPTQAIYFGNINDKDMSIRGNLKGSLVREMLEEEGNYTLLDEELQTRPRTSYLPRYTNRVEKA